tara:strand:+ start:2525 stop:4237 length:1713 start_codon:yes stop_codon:yes gene_type:complete
VGRPQYPNISRPGGGGGIRFGGGILRNSIKNWSSPKDGISPRHYSSNINKYLDKFIKYYGLPEDSYDKRYFVNPFEKGKNYEEGVHGLKGKGNIYNDYNKFQYKSEFISGHMEADPRLSTGTYKLVYNNSGSQTGRALHYYLTADEIKYSIDQDFGTGLFEVSTCGDIECPQFGPYIIQAKQSSNTGYFSIAEQSNPKFLSGEAYYFSGDNTTPSTHTLSFYNTGTESHNLSFFTTGLEENYPYSIHVKMDRKDLQSNQMFSSRINTDIFTEIDSVTGNLTYKSKQNCIAFPRSVSLRKYIKNVEFLFSGNLQSEIQYAYNQDGLVYVTGYETGYRPHLFSAFDISFQCPLLDLDSSIHTYDQNNYWYLGAPTYFTGHRHFSFDEIKINNSQMSGFFVDAKDQISIKTCKHIDLSENTDLVYFGSKSNFSFLETLNLSGCSISGQNVRHDIVINSGDSNGFPGIPPGIKFLTPVSAIQAPNIRSLNLYGNDLNQTGIFSWLFTCMMSSHLPNFNGFDSPYGGKVSGYLNIKNQSHPSSVFSNFNGDFMNDSVLSGIKILSGRGWKVEYDS